MKKLKIISLVLSFVFVSVFAFVGVANAQSFKAGDNVGVVAGETVDSMLFAGGNNIDIAGTVNGDVYCAGQTINISGDVNGDVFCAGQTVTVSGKIDGSVRLAGQTINISGSVAGSATIGAQNLVIDKSAKIGRDLLGGGQNVTINGLVARDVTTGAQNLTVNGSVGRDISGQVESISVGPSGSVVGDINYTSKKEISVASGGVVSGTVSRTEPKAYQRMQVRPETAVAFAIGSTIYVFITTVVFALVLALMFPKVLENSATSTMKSPGMTVLTGFVGMIVAPVSIALLFITIVGLPLAIFVLLSWIIIMMLSGSFASYLLGRLIMRKSKSPVLVMLVGISITSVVLMIPLVNIFVFLAAAMFGTGAILIQGKKLFERSSPKKA